MQNTKVGGMDSGHLGKNGKGKSLTMSKNTFGQESLTLFK